jgi:hypothetical protein
LNCSPNWAAIRPSVRPRDAQRHRAEYDRVVALVFPWPGYQIPQQACVGTSEQRFKEKFGL